MAKPKTIKIDEVEYVRADSINQEAETFDGLPYMMVRTYSAGVFAGYLSKREGKEVTLKNARRIWKWAGAASLSQLAMEGTSDPSNCKFPCEVNEVLLTEAIEIIPISSKAQKSLKEVKTWNQ